MALFNKNPNEVAFTGGKKHWTDVIKNTGSGEFLIWRQPEEDFNTNSTLIVMPGECAVFVNNGEIVKIFEKGTYQLATENYPFISRLRNSFSGGISTFNCVVYFVRKAVSKELLWGTKDPVAVRDKVWGFMTTVGAKGAYKVSISDAGVLLTRLLGNNITELSQNQLVNYFGEELKGKIVYALSNFFNNQWPTELIGLETCLPELAAYLKPQINEMFKDYGLKCEAFSISGLLIDLDKYNQTDEARIQKNKLQILGEDWERLTQADILKTLAANTGAGGIAAAGAGLGLGLSAITSFNDLPGQLFSGSNKNPSTKEIEILREFKQMLDEGLISQAIYDQKVQEVLSGMVGDSK